MKIKGTDLQRLTKIYQDVFMNADFKSFKEAREFSKSMVRFDEELKVVQSLQEKAREKVDFKDEESVKKAAAKLNEILNQEFEMEGASKIKVEHLEGVVTKAVDVALLDRLDLIEDGE